MEDRTYTLGDFKAAERAIKKLSTISFGTDIKTAYWISRIVKKFTSVLKDIENGRIKLITELGVKDEKGTSVPPENIEKFQKNWEDFLSTEIEFDIPLISLSALEKINPTPEDLLVLEKFTVDIANAIEEINKSE